MAEEKRESAFEEFLTEFERENEGYGHISLLFDDKQAELYAELTELVETQGKHSDQVRAKADEFIARLLDHVVAVIEAKRETIPEDGRA